MRLLELATAITLVAVGCLSSFLADQALSKVLQDGSQIFGVSEDGNSSSTATWMRRYPDWTPLVHLNIPGTHESATWNFSEATRASINPDAGVGDPALYRCQGRSLADALNAGIRLFDLRYALDPTDARLVFVRDKSPAAAA